MRHWAILLVVFCIYSIANLGTAESIEIGLGGSAAHSQFVREGNWAYVDQLIALMSDTNVKCTRTNFPCRDYANLILNPSSPADSVRGEEYLSNFQTYLDKCDTASINVILLLAYGDTVDFRDPYEEFNCSEPSPFPPRVFLPPGENTWRQYVSAMMDSFGTQIAGVEVWNEQNSIETFFHGTVADYIELFEITYEEVKEFDVALPVAIGGLASIDVTNSSYLEALIGNNSGIHSQCDAIALHFYDNNALEVLREYHRVCETMSETPRPIWITEFGRRVANPLEKSYLSEYGERAFPEHIFEIFSSYGVEEAIAYTQTVGYSGVNLFEWDEADSTLIPNVKWQYLVDAADKHEDYQIGESIGFGNSAGQDMFGVSPFEEYGTNTAPAVVDPTRESAFDYLYDYSINPAEYPIVSRRIDNAVMAISFDLNDTWVENLQTGRLVMEVELRCDGDRIAVAYQRGGDAPMQNRAPCYKARYDAIPCPERLEGIVLADSVADYQRGVQYESYVRSDTLLVSPGMLETVVLELDDWTFQNGVERRADITFVPIDGDEFEIHRIQLSPVWVSGYARRAEYAVENLPDLGETYLAIEISSDSGAQIDTAYADITNLQAGSETIVTLLDGGPPGDQVAADGIWTALIDSVLASEGQYEIVVTARDELGNTARDALTVTVVEVTSAFVDYSSETNALASNITSQPLAVMPMNAYGDNLVDLLITEVGGEGKFFGASEGQGSVPEFDDWTPTAFDDGDRPSPQTAGSVAADFDNDGHEDFFACHDAEPRLYRWSPTAGRYDIVTAETMSIIPDHVYAAAWGDYNRDGWIDLALAGNFGEPFPDQDPAFGEDNIHIYRNVLGKLVFSQFVPVPLSTAKAAVYLPYSIIWADLDLNDGGQIELIASDARADVDGILVFERPVDFDPLLGDYLFQDVTSTWFPQGAPNRVTQPVLMDIDADGDQDLVVARGGTADNLLFFRNTGYAFSEIDKSAWPIGSFSEYLNGLLVGDMDMDGALDILTAPAGTVCPRLLLNRIGQDMGYVSGAAPDIPDGTVHGGLAFDWLGGKPNVYLAKSPESAGADVDQFFYGYEPVGGAPSNNYVRLKVGTSGLTNATGIGARFEIEWAGNHSYQWIDGGSGRGSQQPRDLVFGVGSYSGPVVVRVLWTNGSTTDFGVMTDWWTDPATASMPFLFDYNGPGIVIDEASVESQYLVGPDDNWLIFEWDADQMALPEVMFYRNDTANAPGCRCMSDSPSGVALNANTTDVETEITQTAEFNYHYKVTWRDRCCYPLCTYEYDVRNTLNGVSTTSDMHEYRTPKICVGNPPQN